MKYLITNWIDISALIVSIIAFIISTRASIKSSRIELSTKLSEILEKIGRSKTIMRDIFSEWCTINAKQITIQDLRNPVNQDEKESFIDFNNSNYHNQPTDKKERLMSNEVRIYLNQLHHLWDRCLNKEFSETDVKNWFSVSINMDADFLLTYLEAHWKEHNEFSKEESARFWYNVPVIIKKAKSWET